MFWGGQTPNPRAPIWALGRPKSWFGDPSSVLRWSNLNLRAPSSVLGISHPSTSGPGSILGSKPQFWGPWLCFRGSKPKSQRSPLYSGVSTPILSLEGSILWLQPQFWTLQLCFGGSKPQFWSSWFYFGYQTPILVLKALFWGGNPEFWGSWLCFGGTKPQSWCSRPCCGSIPSVSGRTRLSSGGTCIGTGPGPGPRCTLPALCWPGTSGVRHWDDTGMEPRENLDNGESQGQTKGPRPCPFQWPISGSMSTGRNSGGRAARTHRNEATAGSWMRHPWVHP